MTKSNEDTANVRVDGWTELPPEPLPAPAYWPALLALGTTFLALGLVTSLIISGVGLFLFAIALVGWIGAMRHDNG
ncbi:MAG: hypothetical protein WBO46_22235 [Caldilineaceae bacterium]